MRLTALGSCRVSLRACLLMAGGFWLAASPCLAGGLDRGADGKFEKRTSSHFVLYQDVDIDRTSGLRGSRRFEQQVLSVLENAYGDVDRYLGLRPSRPISVVVYDPEIFQAQFAGLFRFPAAGFYGGKVHIRGDTLVTERLARILHHELVHAALDAEAPTLVAPAWLNEGMAEWFEARTAGKRRLSPGQQGYLQRVASQGRLLSLGEMAWPSFAHLGPEAARLAYLQSYAFIEHLVRAQGERSLRDLVADYVRTGDLERAVRRSYRTDLARLEERYRAELRAGGRR